MGAIRTEFSSVLGFEHFESGQLAVAASSTNTATIRASAFDQVANRWVEIGGVFEIGSKETIFQFNFPSNKSDSVAPILLFRRCGF